ncbi:MAG: ABC transporter or sensor sytem substrate-binding protein [Olavius algarvensis Delta 4 endosymbiont]|nr:MAG: ABC transporter or sensor sytem substrate-binding protein [Olavius algarvensis Delta 4 endosymbiont]
MNTPCYRDLLGRIAGFLIMKQIEFIGKFVFLMILVLTFSYTPEAGAASKRAFIVHSYESNHVCGIPQSNGIESVLRTHFGQGLSIKSHFMDTKTINSTAEKMQAEAQLVISAIEEFKPDIVFTIDDNAFREVGLHLVGRPFPVVFSGMNGQPATYNKRARFLDDGMRPVANITGVYEKLHFRTALNVMRGVDPKLKHVVALLDKSPTGNAIRVQMQKELDENPADTLVTFKQVGTLSAYLNEIDKINRDNSIQAVYPVVLSIQNDQDESIGFRDTIKAFIQKSEKPGMALNFMFARLGLFGGASVDFGAMGRQAAQLGAKLLKGENIQSLSIEMADEYLITFNIARARMLNIAISDEIIGAAVIFNHMEIFPVAEQGDNQLSQAGN